MRSKIIAFSFVMSVVCFCFSGTIAAQEPQTTPSRKELPEIVLNTELKSARGPVFRLAHYKGNVLVLSFWATWCLPCKFQTPLLVKLQTEFRSEGVKVVELSTEDPVASAKDVRFWMRNYKVNYRVGWAPDQLIKASMPGDTALPQVFIVDRKGTIVKRFVGFNREKSPPVMKEAIKYALNMR